IELKDIADVLEAEDNALEVDFEKLEMIRNRLSKIYQLQQKHGVSTVEELILIESDLASKAFQLDHLDEEIEYLEKVMEGKWKEMKEAGVLLSNKRKASFVPFSENIQQLL